MWYPQSMEFVFFVKRLYRFKFTGIRVLDIGSSNNNENTRFLFDNCFYDSVDTVFTNNVTIVSKTKDLPFVDNLFDTIISIRSFENDPDYKESLLKIYKMLKPNGMFLFSCASTGSIDPNIINTQDSSETVENTEKYYKDLTVKDINDVLNLNENFVTWDTYYNSETCELYFFGIKTGNLKYENIVKYIMNNVTNTSSDI